MKTIEETLTQYTNRVNQQLKNCLPEESKPPTELHQAMHYAVLNGGKRVRPALVYATGESLGVDLEELDACACSVELMHCYSLVHDDLPAMDNDDLRRGLPTCHKAYGEATAILAGDAIQALAFSILANDKAPNGQSIKMIRLLANSSGSTGMAGGQAIDLASVDLALSKNEILHMHRLKTGALIKASVLMAVTASEPKDSNSINCFSKFAEHVGLAFQIRDDILDIQADTEVLGKPQGSDAALNKPTYPSVVGLENAEQYTNVLLEQALNEISRLDSRAHNLREISKYMVQRES